MARTTFCASTEQRCGMDAERLERAAYQYRQYLNGTNLDGASMDERVHAFRDGYRAAMNAAKEPAQAWDAVAWEAARFMVAKVTDVCNKIDRDLKSCDGPASERRRLDTLARGAMAVWAALDESVVREAVSHALRAQRPGGAS